MTDKVLNVLSEASSPRDPSAGDGTGIQKREAFRQTLHALKRRLELLVSLPATKLEKTLIQTTARGLAQE